MGRKTPVLVDLKPTGQHYMEDLYKAGGAATILRELKPLLNLDALTVTGRTLGENIAAAPPSFPQKVVRPRQEPDLQGRRHRVPARQPRSRTARSSSSRRWTRS